MKFEFLDKYEMVSEIPQEFRMFYKETEEDGSLTVNPDTAATFAAVKGMRGALVASREDTKKAKGQIQDLSPLSAYGTTAEEIVAGVNTRVEELEGQVASKGKIDIDKIKADLAAGHDAAMTKANTRIEVLRNQLHSTLVTQQATEALAKAKGNAQLLMPHIQRQVKVTETDAGLEVRVVGDDGETPRYSQTTGGEMSIAELVHEMKSDETFGRAFDSEKKSGGGAAPGSSRGTGIVTSGPNQSSHDKISAGLANRGHRG